MTLQPPTNASRLRNPMPDATEEGLRVENAVLYRELILLHAQAIKFCAALELATGVPWDEVDISHLETVAGMDDVIAQNMARGLNISIDTARERVAQNRALANRSQIETPSQG